MSITLSPEFAWPILAAAAMGFQLVAIGAGVGAARKKYKVDYPDMGSGRFAAKLNDEDWVAFNNVQRSHQNYVEQISSAQIFVLLTGLFCPKFAGFLGFVYIAGRQLYANGYRASGPEGRRAGAILFNISLLTMLLTIVYSCLKLVL
ncbi:membrane-associated proteins in eicosanoid and glutathione metabolism [Basidiobolus meristosporus CBS 931.73]|uniref:Membrane-associated proteins in eicosanoid and glutathione metabolism n=1 Tax=Basidiobolus meristosporus CBS 931.73 TaxID=1314790 RepID=A0A1Y1WYM2_9FUNG|nr:membrane-associated proteins in eicosanoid and glutathione metabolism [Basidiobolus meristosporus CBS 931.73]|eukprot:ORX78651.1 membrane-associated proteins in eicosanoid and glutathione metabolism [Basidiobolus meristosporus CBS 931.73]